MYTTALKLAPLSSAIVISTPENLQHVMKDQFYTYAKGDSFRLVFGDFLGDGIFAEDGVKWKHHRKVRVQLQAVKCRWWLCRSAA